MILPFIIATIAALYFAIQAYNAYKLSEYYKGLLDDAERDLMLYKEYGIKPKKTIRPEEVIHLN